MGDRERSPRGDRRGGERDERRDPERDQRRRRERDSRRRDSRSRSPKRSRHATRHDGSPKRHTHRRHKDHSSRAKPAALPGDLPFAARPLVKADAVAFEPLFAEYLKLQKQRDIEDMDDREVRGRWKSFMGRWNRGELAEGWYDPEMFAKLAGDDAVRLRRQRAAEAEAEAEEVAGEGEPVAGDENDEAEDEDDYGPAPVPRGSLSRDPTRRHGPSIPSLQDLTLRNELTTTSNLAAKESLHLARKADKAHQKAQLDELLPRADAGTHERRQENRALLNEKLRGFRDKSPGPDAVPETELLGGGDSVAEYRAIKEREQRRKTEREVRREEIARARREEMEERRRAWREREEGTVGMLRELARQRFG